MKQDSSFSLKDRMFVIYNYTSNLSAIELVERLMNNEDVLSIEILPDKKRIKVMRKVKK